MAPSKEDVVSEINERVDQAVFHSADGQCKPRVCIVCDHILSEHATARISPAALRKARTLLHAHGFADVHNKELIQSYAYCGEGREDWMDKMLLSPRAQYMKATGRGSKSAFSACNVCKESLFSTKMPVWAIANKYTFGGNLPHVFETLTEVEWALLTPIKQYGFTFTYQGGRQRKLRGVLSFFKVKVESIVRAVMQLEALGLNGHVVVLLTGQMTKKQIDQATQLSTIRVTNVIDAIRWLKRNNHHEWKNADIDGIRRKLEDMEPLIVDESIPVDDSGDAPNSNIEDTLSFAAYFPDGSMQPVFGGHATIKDFKTLVEQAHANMADIHFQCNLIRERVQDYKDDNFAKACLQQMPYGFGGMQEQRYNSAGKLTSDLNLKDYVEHLSKISMRRFHHPLFVLILQSIWQRQTMLQASTLRIRGKYTHETIANNLTTDDVAAHAKARVCGHYNGTAASRKLLDCVDAVSRALPHTDGAATKARTEVECLVHHFGFPSHFLTFAPDDENSHLLQVFSGVTIDNATPVCDLTDEDLMKRCKKRRELRIQVPGLSAHYFEIALDIVLRSLLGIDLETMTSSGQDTYLGKVRAALVTIEEQGRSTLHAHILVWIDEIKEHIETTQRINTPDNARKNSMTHIQSHLNDIATTELVGTQLRAVTHIFAHDCTDKYLLRKGHLHVEPPSLQQLRNLRHKLGGKETEYLYAHCTKCGRCFTHEEIVERYLKNHVQVAQQTSFPEEGVDRLKAMCIQHQKINSTPIDKGIINAAYNTHFSFHTKTCFKKRDAPHKPSSSCKRHKTDDIECRARMPDLSRERDTVEFPVENASWFSWTGHDEKRHLAEIAPKRAHFDELQNVSLPAISESKLTCNSNISVHTAGPIVFYVTKYMTKSNRHDETVDYSKVVETIQRMLADTDSERAHDDDRKEAQRRILRASFAHNSTNVMGAPMASWLTRHGTRFLFTHKFSWCPLKDLGRLLVNRPVDYRFRPGNGDEVAEFIPTSYYLHPSLNKKGTKAKQGSKLRDTPFLLKLRQWEFLDSADFNGNILDPKIEITPATERQSRLILILFYPHRCNQDLLLRGRHTRKLQQAFRTGKLKSAALDKLGITVEEYLQNLQDCRANCTRHKTPEDKLTRNTLPYISAESMCPTLEPEDCSDDDDEEVPLQPQELESLLDSLFGTAAAHRPDEIPTTLNLKHLQSKTKRPCDKQHITNGGSIPQASFQSQSFVVETPIQQNNTPPGSPPDQHTLQPKKQHSRGDLVKTIATHKRIRHRTEHLFGNDINVKLHDANGSAKSIILWGRQFKLDAEQRRTFEILASSFVLTFFDEAKPDDEVSLRTNQFISQHRKLKRLSARSETSPALIAFIHGPGGCGKTTVVDLVKLYCQEYCSYLQHPFTSETIVVTALTGSAATLLLGETTHRALNLNCSTLTPEHADMWSDTRLLVIDEISFASPQTIAKIDTNLRIFRSSPWKRFGGINIVFSGDLSQLKAIKQDSIIDTPCPQFDEWVNCYIELHGLHRFKDDPEWGRLLTRFRNGVPTMNDFARINERVVTSDTVLPDNTKYATSVNADRDAINTAVFEKHCIQTAANNNGLAADAIIILSDHLSVNTGKNVRPLINRSVFWEGCGEDNVDVSGGKTSERVDPALKLFQHCEVMLTKNFDVKSAKANGTRALVQQVILKPGETTFLVQVDDIRIPAVFASSVSQLLLQHVNKAARPPNFVVEPKSFSVKASIPTQTDFMSSTKREHRCKLDMTLTQVPVVSNTATTCHKLQGVGVDNMYVTQWRKDGSWIYVILSRVKTRSGLFLREELPPDVDLHRIPPALQKKLRRFRSKSVRPTLAPRDYDNLLA